MRARSARSNSIRAWGRRGRCTNSSSGLRIRAELHGSKNEIGNAQKNIRENPWQSVTWQAVVWQTVVWQAIVWQSIIWQSMASSCVGTPSGRGVHRHPDGDFSAAYPAAATSVLLG